MRRGEVWWADRADPVGSGPGFRRPVVIVQSDAFNRSHIHTVIAVVLTSNAALLNAPGNVLVSAASTGLGRDSVANVSQLVTVDRATLTERVGRVPSSAMRMIDDGLRLALELGSART